MAEGINSLLFYFGKYYFVRKTPAVTDLQNRLAAVCMFIKNCVWCLLYRYVDVLRMAVSDLMNNYRHYHDLSMIFINCYN